MNTESNVLFPLVALSFESSTYGNVPFHCLKVPIKYGKMVFVSYHIQQQKCWATDTIEPNKYYVNKGLRSDLTTTNTLNSMLNSIHSPISNEFQVWQLVKYKYNTTICCHFIFLRRSHSTRVTVDFNHLYCELFCVYWKCHCYW